MDALVDRLIERIEALGRWGRAQTRRGFDRATRSLPWDEQMVLRELLWRWGDRAREVAGMGLIVGVFAMAQWRYYRRFVVGADSHDSLFRVFWQIFAWFGLLPEVMMVLVVLVVVVGNLERLVRWQRSCPAPWRWKHALTGRWTVYRDTAIERHWRTRPERMAALEQQVLRRAVEPLDHAATSPADPAPGMTVRRERRRL